jgi:hypothetical protein
MPEKNQGVYRNSTELMQLAGHPIYLPDLVNACLYGRLNLFLIGDTGSGKTQLARDAMADFGNESLFILGRNDMDTRELFQQINPEFLKAVREGSQTKANIRNLTDKIGYHLIVVDELPNCVPAVRAQLFNLFDGFIEVDGKAYPIGKDYSVGIATGNLGQKFTESSNDLGRALKDRMHVIVDVDYFHPTSSDTLEILAGNTNPRVEFSSCSENCSKKIIEAHKELVARPIPLEKLILANYFVHGLDYCQDGQSKRKMKDSWPVNLESHAQGSDEALVLPLSMRAAKSVIRLSQALDKIVQDKAENKADINPTESMLQAYKFVAAYSGILNEALVRSAYDGDKYEAINSIISATNTQLNNQYDHIAAGIEMAKTGKEDERVLNLFAGRWDFMKDILKYITKQQSKQLKEG